MRAIPSICLDSRTERHQIRTLMVRCLLYTTNTTPAAIWRSLLPPAPRRLRSPGPRPDGPRRRSIGHRSEQSSFRQQLFFSERQLPFCRPQRQPVKTLSVSVSTGLPNGQPFGVCRYLLLLGLLASTNGCQQPSAPVVEVARFRVGLAIARKMESSSFIVVIYCYHQCC